MHERTQRAVARLLFVFCCAVPTGLLLLSVIVTWTPWYQAHRRSLLEHTLQQETGLAIQIERCRELAPGKFKLESVRLEDPESGRPVAVIESIDWLTEDSGTRIVLHQPELRSAALGDAWTLIHDRLIRRPEQTLKPLLIVADDLTIRSSGGSITHDVEVSVTPKETGVLLLARAKDNLEEDSFLQCTLFRDRSGATPTTQVSLSTGNTPLPCSAVDDYFPVLRRLGPDAHFRGTMEFRELPDRAWSYNFDGTTISGISLSRLSDNLPYRVSGTASIHLARCEVVPGQSVNLSSVINIPDGGWIESRLLVQLIQRVGLVVNRDADHSIDGKVQYSKGAFSLTITNERMTLRGLCRRGEDYPSEPAHEDIALCQFGLPLAQTSGDFPSDAITTIFSPPRTELAYWNGVLLPSPKPMRIATAPAATATNGEQAAADSQQR
ncbi:MAG: hypothetical protein AAFX06_27200 [Planctomycetota bacterium]